MRDSVVMKTTIYYSTNQGDCIEPDYYKTLAKFLRWAKSDSATPIVITGWADPSGSEALNNKLSLRRARTVRNYLVKKGISSERISFEGRGIDRSAESYDKARRADLCGMIRLAVKVQPKEVVRGSAVTSKAETKQTSTNDVEQSTPVIAEEPMEQQQIVEFTPIHTSAKQSLRWYAGIEGGISLGVSALSSFSPQGGADWTAGLFGGYRFSPLLSLEVGANLGKLKLGATSCCEEYWLGSDGIRYLGRVTGMDSYSYKNIHSSVSIQQYALRLNVDMLQIVRSDWDKRWSLTVSPAVYGINTKATLKTDDATIIKRNGQFQFGAGAGIGVGVWRSLRRDCPIQTQ